MWIMSMDRVAFTCALLGMIGGLSAAGPTTKPYSTAHDRPLDAVQKLVEDAPNHTKYRVEFNGIKARVPANLYVPKGAKGEKKRFPAVLLQYGGGGNKNTNYIVAIALKAVERGFVVLTIDIPHRGERKN